MRSTVNETFFQKTEETVNGLTYLLTSTNNTHTHTHTHTHHTHTHPSASGSRNSFYAGKMLKAFTVISGELVRAWEILFTMVLHSDH